LWHYVYPASELVRRHIDNLLTYYQHPVINAMSEALKFRISRAWPAAFTISRSKRQSTSTAEDVSFTHAEPGSALKGKLSGMTREGTLF
jgi:hypothetical protein